MIAFILAVLVFAVMFAAASYKDDEACKPEGKA